MAKLTVEELYKQWIVDDTPPEVGTIFIDNDLKEYKIIKVNEEDLEVEEYNGN